MLVTSETAGARRALAADKFVDYRCLANRHARKFVLSDLRTWRLW